MIKNVSDSVEIVDLQCESADVADLPTNVAEGSTCYVVDTKIVKVFHDGQWYSM